MTKDELGARVRAIITDHLQGTYRGDKGEAEITDASVLVEDPEAQSLGLDSLDLVEISLELECEFNIELDDEQVADLVTVAHLIEHLGGKLGVVDAAAAA